MSECWFGCRQWPATCCLEKFPSIAFLLWNLWGRRSVVPQPLWSHSPLVDCFPNGHWQMGLEIAALPLPYSSWIFFLYTHSSLSHSLYFSNKTQSEINTSYISISSYMHPSNYWTFLQLYDRFIDKASSDWFKNSVKNACLISCGIISGAYE